MPNSLSFYYSDGQTEQQYCKSQHSCETNLTGLLSCNNPPHSKFSHEECYKSNLDVQSMFEALNFYDAFWCLNRMDRKDSMFRKSLFQKSIGSKKMSLLLNYTEDYFVCGDDNYNWTSDTLDPLWVRAVSHNTFLHNQLKALSLQYENDYCELLDKTYMPLPSVLAFMVMDQSLIMKEYPHVRQVLQDFFEKHLLGFHYHCGDESRKSCAENYTDSNGNTYHLCIPDKMFCDGIPQCPNLSDEAFELCLDNFPTSATKICPAANIFNNKTIMIKAVQCDGLVECRDQSDEEDCKVNKNTFTITTVVGLVLLFIVAVLTITSVELSEKDKLSLDFTERLAKDEKPDILLKIHPLVVVSQGTKHQKNINFFFIQVLKKLHKNDLPLILKTIKVLNYSRY